MQREITEIIEEFKLLGTSVVSDSMDSLGLKGCIKNIHSKSGCGHFCGTAFTVRYEPEDGNGGGLGSFVEQVEPGQVVILDNYGRTDCTVWGGLTSTYAMHHGFAATVINGVFRDSDAVRGLGYNIFAIGSCMSTGKGRTRCVEIGGRLCISGVSINAGDIILGDGDGVICVPIELAEKVLSVAKEYEEADLAVEKAVTNGMGLTEATVKFGRNKSSKLK